MENKKNLYVTLLVILTIAVVIFTIVTSINKKTNKKENQLEVVTNYTEFYIVDSCADRFITSITLEDTDSLLKQLSNSYKKNNNINETNVLNIIGKLDVTRYKTKKIYYQKINDNVTKYYVHGILIKENLSTNTEAESEDFNVESEEFNDYYLIIYIYNKNNIFSVEPYDGKIFISGDIDGK